MFVLHVFIVVVVVFLGVIIPKRAAAASESDPGGIVILKQLRNRINSAPYDPALQRHTLERSINAIVKFKMPEENPSHTSGPSGPRPPHQSAQTFEMLTTRYATPSEKTLYMELFIMAHAARINVGSILSSFSDLPYPASNTRYKDHWTACFTLWNLVTGTIEPIEKPGTVTVTEADKKSEIAVTFKTLDDKYQYFNTELDPAITGPLQDVAAVKARQQGKSSPVIRIGFVKFVDNVKARYYSSQAFLSPHCIVKGVPYQLATILPSNSANFGAAFYHISTLTWKLDFQSLSHNVSIKTAINPWFHQPFDFIYDGLCLGSGVSSPAKFVAPQPYSEKKEIKERKVISYPDLNPGFVIRQNLGNNPNFFFTNTMDSSKSSCYMLPPTEKRTGQTLNSLGFYTNASVDPQPYSLTKLGEGQKIYTSLAVLSPTIIAFTYIDSSGHSRNLVIVKQAAAKVLQEIEAICISQKDPLYQLVKGPDGISYVFEGKNFVKGMDVSKENFTSLSIVHILSEKDPKKAIQSIPCNFDTLISHTLTLERHLIVAGTKDGKTMLRACLESKNHARSMDNCR